MSVMEKIELVWTIVKCSLGAFTLYALFCTLYILNEDRLKGLIPWRKK